ncbi:MAG: N4-gp56 family major capsid protein [Endomicrobium sp.]|jgi:N4-gp56 family major capsid protein|nr:N4-gp56 family major capsid protein [Endomicrobium sp.]
MADTQVITQLNKTVWSTDLFFEALEGNWFAKAGLMGEGTNNIVELKSDLKKEQGEKVRFGLVYNLEGEGVEGDYMLEENEEDIKTSYFDVLVDLKRNAVRSKGKLADQKAAVNLRKQFKSSLSGWMQDIAITRQIFLKLGGVQNLTLKNVNGKAYSASAKWSNTPNPVPTSDILAGKGKRYLNSVEGALASITAADVITPGMINVLKSMAELAEPKILPLEVEGGKYYVLLVHPYQFAELKTNAIILDGFKYAADRGKNNPIFAGGDTFHYDGVIVKSHPFVPYLNPADLANKNFEDIADEQSQAATPIARAIFCGRQAAAFAQCKNSEGWEEKGFDYGNKQGVATGLLGGIAKTHFDGVDFGVIVLDTAVNAPKA